jgi:hypothetical protein
VSKVSTFGLLIITLAGCASTADNYQNYSTSNASCVGGDFVNPWEFILQDRAFVNILSIDGSPIGSTKTFCVEPGAHLIEVSARNSGMSAYGSAYLVSKAGRKYQFQSILTGIVFSFKIFDITDGQKLFLGEFSFNPVSGQEFIPTFISQ